MNDAVSRKNAETIRSGFKLFNERRLEEWFLLFDPEAEWHTRRDEPDASIHRGSEGVRQLVEAWIESFPNLRVEPEEVLAFGDWVVGLTRLHGSGGASGIAVDDIYVFAYRLRDGRIVETHEYTSKAEAFQALGVAEQDAEKSLHPGGDQN
jgi:ketosteroid isomerase-like protein